MGKSSYKKYILIVFLFFLIIVHLIAFNVKRKERLNFFERTVLFVALPAQKLISGVTKKMKEVWGGYIYLVGLGKKNALLEDKVQVLRAKLDRFNELEAENKRLKDLLSFTKEAPYRYVAARVVSTGPSNFYHTLVIDKGIENGIRRGMAVLTTSGVVGQISYVTKGYSGVITIVDPNSAIDAIDQKTRARGILKGHKFRKLIFKYLPFSEKVYVGDRVISSGLDGIYPKGIAVGNVEEVKSKKERLFQNVTVEPAVNFAKLEEVLVQFETAKGNTQK